MKVKWLSHTEVFGAALDSYAELGIGLQEADGVRTP
jgi:hypothetical protein